MDQSQKAAVFRARFYGRQDVYGRRFFTHDAAKDIQVRNFAPVCTKFWTDVCHIKNKTNIRCSQCTHREWAPITDASALRHIESVEVQNVYLLQLDGTIHFGAMDFDVKEGKEDQGYDWSEVVKVCDILKNQGIPYAVARSTSAGYHIYLFFKEPYLAARFKAVVAKLFKTAGFDQYIMDRVKNQLPEVFPKQDYIDKDSLGNGITPPMGEAQILIGRNCFVDSENVVIGEGLSDEEKINAQWEYLDSIPLVDGAVLDRLIEIYQLSVGPSRPVEKSAAAQEYASMHGERKPIGSVEKVIYGCDAFKRIFESVKETGQLGFLQGSTLYHMAMNTEDGKEWFLKNTPWGQNADEIKELEFSENKRYGPWSCGKMMEMRLCTKTVPCAEAAPKGLAATGAAADDGALEGLSAAEKKKYNPYRFSLGPGDEFFHQLLKEVGDLAAESEAAVKEEKLRDILQRLQVLDKKKQRDFKTQLELVQKQLKIPKNKTAPMFKAAEQDHVARIKANLGGDPTVYPVESKTYRKHIGTGRFGYSEIKASKSEVSEILLCEADIDITEIRTYMGETTEETSTFYFGEARGLGVDTTFNINSDIWAHDQKFQLFFTRLLGTAFTPLRCNLELIKQASIGWSRQTGAKAMMYLTSQGFYEERYLMPSVIVDRDGLRPNETNPVDLSMKQFCKNLDFSILPEDDFIATLAHIKNEFMVAWPEDWTYLGLPHVLLPVAINKFGWTARPTFFLDGESGLGKTSLTQALQQFWGNFPQLVSLMLSSEKYLGELAYEFKDACVVFDDFKELTAKQRDSVLHTIQHGFDGNVGGKCNRDGTLKKAHGNRSVMIMSGERFIQNHASVVARTILLEVGKFDANATETYHASVLAMQGNYRGVTPRFISWVLNLPSEPYADELIEVQRKLRGPSGKRNNAARVSTTFACNHIVFKLWTQFLHEHGVATTEERDEMNKTHLRLVKSNHLKMLDRCEEEQESVVFKDMLLELILSGAASIMGHNSEFEVENKPVIGAWDPNNPTRIYMYPKLTFKLVTDSQRNGAVANYRATMRQLIACKVICEFDAQALTKSVRFEGRSQRMLVIDAVALGLIDPPAAAQQYPVAVPPLNQSSAKLITIRPGIEAALGSDGIF
ncbi:MAG: hypothetical protein MUP21_02740 [Dehalococcoidia bacterium]|nr:hypothetical protein [Dehalococcoidia bacterium]